MVERIGRCGWCGLVDHHLVDETCPACRRKVTDVGAPEHDYDDVPLGYEAADISMMEVSHVHEG